MGANVMDILANNPLRAQQTANQTALTNAQIPGIQAQGQQAQLQAQMMQQQLQDQRVLSQAWQSSNGDWDAFTKAAKQGGLSWGGYAGLMNDHIAMQKNLANLTEAQNAAMKPMLDQKGQLYESIKDAGPEGSQARLNAAQQVGQHLGEDPSQLLTDQQLNTRMASVNYLASSIDNNLKAEQANTQQSEQRKNQAAASESAAKLPGEQADSELKQQEAKAASNFASNPQAAYQQIDTIFPKSIPGNTAPNLRYKSMLDFYIGRGDFKGAAGVLEKANAEAGDIAKETNPQVQAGKVATAAATGAAEAPARIQAAQIEAQNNASIASDKEARAAYMKSAQNLVSAQSVDHDFAGLLQLARTGNKAAGSNLPLVGVETLNALNGIKRMNGSEIAQYEGAGSLLDRIKGEVGKLAVGQPIPEDVLNDVSKMHQLLSQGATQKHQNEVNLINKTYGKNYQPFTPQFSNGGGGSGATIRVKSPNGQIGSIPAANLNKALAAGYTQVQ